MSALSFTFCRRFSPSFVALELICSCHPRRVDGHERCLVLVNREDLDIEWSDASRNLGKDAIMSERRHPRGGRSDDMI